MHRILFLTLFVLASIAPPAMAHGKRHTGTKVEGEITSMSGDRMEVKSGKGNMNVMLDSKTAFEKDEKTVDRNSLKTGDKVTVWGNKMTNGQIHAKEVETGTITGKIKEKLHIGKNKKSSSETSYRK